MSNYQHNTNAECVSSNYSDNMLPKNYKSSVINNAYVTETKYLQHIFEPTGSNLLGFHVVRSSNFYDRKSHICWY